MFALADCNNFFVSCERVFRPDLEGKPVVVLSNNDGCAISRSNEAKKLGIRMGQPVFEFRHLIESGAVTVFSSNFSLYGDMSRRVQRIIADASPAIEVYSIDESFVDLNGMVGMDFDLWAKNLSKTCRRGTGIPVSIGVAPTKTLAKIASKLCKKYPRLQGGCCMYRPEDITMVLDKFPIEDVWGIGRKYSRQLRDYHGIFTAGDFRRKGRQWASSLMGASGARTWCELQGIPSIEFEDIRPPKKQIMFSRTFSEGIEDMETLSSQISVFCSSAVEKLRRQASCAQSVSVFISFGGRSTGYRQTDARTALLPVATDSTIEINRAAMSLTHEIHWRAGGTCKRAGIILGNIVPASEVQLSFFDTTDREKHSRLMEAIDKVNSTDGRSHVVLASMSANGIRMHREHLSPAYTTSWDDILTVYCK